MHDGPGATMHNDPGATTHNDPCATMYNARNRPRARRPRDISIPQMLISRKRGRGPSFRDFYRYR
jgi:hypothetical protein